VHNSHFGLALEDLPGIDKHAYGLEHVKTFRCKFYSDEISENMNCATVWMLAKLWRHRGLQSIASLYAQSVWLQLKGGYSQWSHLFNFVHHVSKINMFLPSIMSSCQPIRKSTWRRHSSTNIRPIEPRLWFTCSFRYQSSKRASLEAENQRKSLHLRSQRCWRLWELTIYAPMTKLCSSRLNARTAKLIYVVKRNRWFTRSLSIYRGLSFGFL